MSITRKTNDNVTAYMSLQDMMLVKNSKLFLAKQMKENAEITAGTQYDLSTFPSVGQNILTFLTRRNKFHILAFTTINE